MVGIVLYVPFFLLFLAWFGFVCKGWFNVYFGFVCAGRLNIFF